MNYNKENLSESMAEIVSKLLENEELGKAMQKQIALLDLKGSVQATLDEAIKVFINMYIESAVKHQVLLTLSDKDSIEKIVNSVKGTTIKEQLPYSINKEIPVTK